MPHAHAHIHAPAGPQVGNEVRGVVTVGTSLPFGPYAGTASFIMLIDAAAAGETVTFKFWDGADVWDCPETISFAIDAVIGSVPSPYIVTTAVTLTVSLSAGWSWLSINVAVPAALNLALGELASNLTQNDTIKSISQFSTYYDGYGWYSALTELAPISSHATCTCHVHMPRAHATCTCHVHMPRVVVACTCRMSHAHATCAGTAH